MNTNAHKIHHFIDRKMGGDELRSLQPIISQSVFSLQPITSANQCFSMRIDPVKEIENKSRVDPRGYPRTESPQAQTMMQHQNILRETYYEELADFC